MFATRTAASYSSIRTAASASAGSALSGSAAAAAAAAAAVAPASSRRCYASAPVSTSSSSSSSAAMASLLKTTAAAALDTPGLAFTAGPASTAASSSNSGNSKRHPHAPLPATASINMCTVRISSASSPPSSSSTPPTTTLHARATVSVRSRSRPSLPHSFSSLSLSPSSLRSVTTSASSRASAVVASSSSDATSPPSQPPIYPRKVRKTFDPKRRYPERKRFLFSAYARLLSSSNLLVLLQYGNLTVAEWTKLRASLAAVELPADADPNTPRAGIVAVRAAMLRALLKSHPNPHVKKLGNACSGPLAFLYFPTSALVDSVGANATASEPAKKAGGAEEGKDASADQEQAKPTIDDIDPRYVERVLNVIDRALGGKAIPAPPKDLDPFSVTDKQITPANPRLLPLGALFYPARAVQPESASADAPKRKQRAVTSGIPLGFQAVPASEQPPMRLMPVLSLRAIAANLPDIHVLRAQMVGLLGAPAQSLVGTLTSAGGAGLVRVLKGYVAGLEEEQQQQQQQQGGDKAKEPEDKSA